MKVVDTVLDKKKKKRPEKKKNEILKMEHI